jgi:hypothetical protein
MIKVIYGRKGTGKTKMLVDTANRLTGEGTGEVVFIDDDKELMYDLNHKIRFINVAEFPVACPSSFIGFICGIISEDFDINSILVDGLTYIVKEDADSLEGFFKSIDEISKKFEVDFYISLNGNEQEVPEYMQSYI